MNMPEKYTRLFWSSVNGCADAITARLNTRAYNRVLRAEKVARARLAHTPRRYIAQPAFLPAAL